MRADLFEKLMLFQRLEVGARGTRANLMANLIVRKLAEKSSNLNKCNWKKSTLFAAVFEHFNITFHANPFIVIRIRNVINF